VSVSTAFLSPAEAAAQLGISAKALRLYEQRALVTPLRSAAGWRTYGPDQMARAREIVALRELGLSLREVGDVFSGDQNVLADLLQRRQAGLEGELVTLAGQAAKLRELRSALAAGKAVDLSDLTSLSSPPRGLSVSFDLPWPWGGERLDLRDLGAITFIVGPLGSGKTVLAKRLAAEIPDASFIAMDRANLAPVETGEHSRQVDAALAWLAGDGATPSPALSALVAELERADTPLVVDMVEEGLDQPTQEALLRWLRRRLATARPLLLMTRSSAILDFAETRRGETVIFCPANHSLPLHLLPIAGVPGFEALASCLATPEVRARTAGVVAIRSSA